MRLGIGTGVLLLGLALVPGLSRAEQPGEARPQPVPSPTEKVGATGVKVQPPDTLPKSRVPFPATHRKPKLAQKGQPSLRNDNELMLNAGWELAEAPKVDHDGKALSRPGVETPEWYDATVPGTVLTTLVEQGVYPDPYLGLNNLAIPESLNKQDYWYRTEFNVPADFAQKHLTLQFQGINYYAEVYFNGEYLGHITGAFIRGDFDVTKKVKLGEVNVLAVKVCPPPDPGNPSEQSVKFGPGDNGGKLCLDGPTFVCAEGWDWIPAIRDRCTGIWQDVILRATGPIVLSDPQVITDLPLPDTSRADVSVRVDVSNPSDRAARGVLKVSFEGVTIERAVNLQPHQTEHVTLAPKDFPQLALKNPRLWWPNGHGKPELYHLTLDFLADGKTSDHHALRFGIREMTYEFAATMPDGTSQRVEFSPTTARGEPVIENTRKAMKWREGGKEALTQVRVRAGAENSPALKKVDDPAMGPYLVVKVNGKRILCRGGNWGMDDALKRISRERLEPYVRLHRDANLNMIRNWSGQSTSEAFYDLCDEYGILVWNDFWMDTEGWNYRPVDHELFLRNVADTIKRYRNHPSIALWCAMNEGVPPDAINDGNDRLIRELDGTRYYQPNSRLVNLRTSGPWSNMPLEKYFTDLNHGFSTEMGASSIPTVDAVRAMMAPEDLWPPDDVWAYHDFHSKGAGDRPALMKFLNNRYGEPKDLDDLCRKAQMVNYETYRATYESFNSRMWNDASGVLVWMSHPSWPSMVWQFYSSDYEPNGALFGVKKACEPVHVQMSFQDAWVIVINNQSEPLANARVTGTIRDLSGHEVVTRSAKVTAGPNSVTQAFELAPPGDEAYFFTLRLENAAGQVLSENLYWHARDATKLQQLSSLPKAKLTSKLHVEREAKGKTHIVAKIANDSDVPAFAIRLTLREARNGQRILPVYYSDNYVTLLPRAEREIAIDCGTVPSGLQLSLDGWNLEAANSK